MMRLLLVSLSSLFVLVGCPSASPIGEGEGDAAEGEGEGDVGAGEGEGEGEPAVAVVIADGSWAPNRDADGNVLLTDYAQLPANTWVTVSGEANQLRDVEPMPAYPSGYGPTGFAQTVTAWGGAAWDDVHQRMILSGGGHGDASAAETAVFTADAATMRVARTVERQPLDSPLRLVDGALEAGEGFPGGTNAPLSTGVPGSMHTYEGLVWLPTETMQSIGLGSPARGGLFYPGNATAIVDLDTGAYSKLHYTTAYYDISYVTAVRWQNTIVLPLGGFYFRRMNLAGNEMTDWQTSGFDPDPSIPSHMALLPSTTTDNNFVQGGRLFCDMPERGEMVSFAAVTTRVRYGAAEDSAEASWTMFHEVITLTGAGASDFAPDNLVDLAGSLLSQGGGHYLHSTGEIFVAPNVAGRELYRITGVDTLTWNVERIAGTALLTSSVNATYGRFVVFERGGATLAMRISSVDNPIEVIRLQ
jgi:hypothetical protein